MTRAATPHGCPHCRCHWDTTDDCGRVNRDAPCYPLVELVDEINHYDRCGQRPPKEAT